MYRIIVFLVILCSSALQASAQSWDSATFELSFWTGISQPTESSNRFKDPMSIYDRTYRRYDLHSLTGQDGGVRIGYWFANQLGIATGWGLSVRGSLLDASFESIDSKGEVLTQTRITSLEIPILITYRPLTTGRLALEVASGVTYGLDVSGRSSSQTTYHYYNSEDLMQGEPTEWYKLQNNLALCGEIGVKFWATNSIGLLLNAGYSHGLSTLEYFPDYRTSRGFRISSGISIHAGDFSR